MEANKILFNFIWKGKDKVKRSILKSDVEKGGLRAPHLESTIKTQRILWTQSSGIINTSALTTNRFFIGPYLKKESLRLKTWKAKAMT